MPWSISVFSGSQINGANRGKKSDEVARSSRKRETAAPLSS